MGKVNSGKSSLINRLSNENISIVSDIEGTTRDLVKSRI
jgi:GTPase